MLMIQVLSVIAFGLTIHLIMNKIYPLRKAGLFLLIAALLTGGILLLRSFPFAEADEKYFISAIVIVVSYCIYLIGNHVIYYLIVHPFRKGRFKSFTESYFRMAQVGFFVFGLLVVLAIVSGLIEKYDLIIY